MTTGIIDNKYLTAEWRNNGRIFFYAWKGFVPGLQMRSLLDDLLAEYAKGDTPLMLQDLTMVKAVGPEDQAWIYTNWMPRAIAAGMRKVAILTPASAFGQMAASNVSIRAKINGLEIYNQFFAEYAEAEAWLLADN